MKQTNPNHPKTKTALDPQPLLLSNLPQKNPASHSSKEGRSIIHRQGKAKPPKKLRNTNSIHPIRRKR